MKKTIALRSSLQVASYLAMTAKQSVSREIASFFAMTGRGILTEPTVAFLGIKGIHIV